MNSNGPRSSLTNHEKCAPSLLHINRDQLGLWIADAHSSEAKAPENWTYAGSILKGASCPPPNAKLKEPQVQVTAPRTPSTGTVSPPEQPPTAAVPASPLTTAAAAIAAAITTTRSV